MKSQESSKRVRNFCLAFGRKRTTRKTPEVSRRPGRRRRDSPRTWRRDENKSEEKVNVPSLRVDALPRIYKNRQGHLFGTYSIAVLDFPNSIKGRRSTDRHPSFLLTPPLTSDRGSRGRGPSRHLRVPGALSHPLE